VLNPIILKAALLASAFAQINVTHIFSHKIVPVLFSSISISNAFHLPAQKKEMAGPPLLSNYRQ
jgi:hypothetical protein